MGISNMVATIPGFAGPAVVGLLTSNSVSRLVFYLLVVALNIALVHRFVHIILSTCYLTLVLSACLFAFKFDVSLV